MRTNRRIVALLILGAVTSAIANAARPKPFRWTRQDDIHKPDVAQKYHIKLEEVRQHVASNSATFIDARREDQFAAGHLRGALCLPSDAFSSADPDKQAFVSYLYANVPPNALVIIYCDGGTCDASKTVFEQLKANGFSNLRLFEEGWAAIAPSDLPREYGPMQLNPAGMPPGG